MTTVLGIDIGGTGIKGAPVDTRTGQLLADRHRILTPHPATPEAVTGVVAELAKFFEWTGPAGAAFPAVIKHGVAKTAANVDQQWIGADAGSLFTTAITLSESCPSSAPAGSAVAPAITRAARPASPCRNLPNHDVIDAFVRTPGRQAVN